MLTSTLEFFAVAALGHAVNTFVSYLIHFVQHRRIFGLAFYRIHLRAHHGPRDHPPRAVDVVLGHTVWGVGIGAGCALYLLVLPQWMAWLWIVQALLLTAGLYWIHAEYDNASSRLMRFAWFRRCRDWHGVHHAPSQDFSRGCNYAIGGPLLGLAVDRALGTFADRATRGNPATVAVWATR